MFFKIFNFLLASLNVVYLYFINTEPSKFQLITAVFIAINIAALFIFVFTAKPNQKSITNIFSYALFLISLVALFIFVKSDTLKIILYVFGFIMSFLSLMHIRYLIIHNRENYFLNDVDFYVFLFSSFLAPSSLFALNIFMGLNKMILVLIAFVFFFIFYFCIYYYHAKESVGIYRYIFASSLLSSEVFLAASFLPYSFYVNAIFVLLFNFVLSSTVKDFLLNKFNKKYFNKIVICVLFFLVVVLLTAKRV